MQGLLAYCIFSLTRVAVYAIFGGLVGLFGEFVMRRFFESGMVKILFFVFGMFLLFLGTLLIMEKFSFGKKCRGFIHEEFYKKDLRNLVVFGTVVSCSPCLPLLAVLAYVALISDFWLKGIVYMAAFGLGTVISPMIFLALFASVLGPILKRHKGVFQVLRMICGVIMAFIGIRFMVAQ